MININLDFDEVVITGLSDISFDTSFNTKGKGDVTLTSKRIIIQKKGFFGGIKETIIILKSDIKMYEGLPQIKLADKSKPDRAVIDIFTLRGQYELNFIGDKKRLAKPFLNETYKAFGDKEVVDKWLQDNRFFSKENVEKIAQTIKGTLDTVMDTILPPEMTTGSCKNCGGQINGFVGRVSKCNFCGTQQKL